MKSFLKRIYRLFFGMPDLHWSRVIMYRKADEYMRSLKYKDLAALEISGSRWKDFGFSDYKSVNFPEFDICKDRPFQERFDVIIAEQVLEHVLWPYRAVKNLHKMLNQGGVLLVTTPFLLKVHDAPSDSSRWTETGIKHLLSEGGFDIRKIRTGSWGNKSCVIASLKRWPDYSPIRHSLKNEPEFPVVVWAFAQKT